MHQTQMIMNTGKLFCIKTCGNHRVCDGMRSLNTEDKHMKLCTCNDKIHYNGHNLQLLNPSKTLIKYKMF